MLNKKYLQKRRLLPFLHEIAILFQPKGWKVGVLVNIESSVYCGGPTGEKYFQSSTFGELTMEFSPFA